MIRREQILQALDAFARQRPGLDPRNYISDWRDIEGRKMYRQESRAITRDLHDFQALLAQVAWRSSITANDLREAFSAYSGRLRLTEENGSVALEYCTGQYFPTEYRKAACAVLSSALFNYFRSCLASSGEEFDGDDIRAHARRELGARLARRWVD
jgi:hypothetical protein